MPSFSRFAVSSEKTTKIIAPAEKDMRYGKSRDTNATAITPSAPLTGSTDPLKTPLKNDFFLE